MNKRTIMTVTLAGLVGLSAYTIYTLPAPEKPQAPAPVKQEAKAFPYEKEVHPFTPSPAVPLSDDLQRFTKAQADMNGVPYIIALAVMEQESRFDLSADSGDSVGVMQINTCHGPKEIIMEPYQNIRIGCRLLGMLYKEYHDWNKVLVAYNCGPAGAYEMYFRHGSISSPYSREVMFRTEKFAVLLGEESVLRPPR